jgi:hypothetical protein
MRLTMTVLTVGLAAVAARPAVGEPGKASALARLAARMEAHS